MYLKYKKYWSTWEAFPLMQQSNCAYTAYSVYYKNNTDSGRTRKLQNATEY